MQGLTAPPREGLAADVVRDLLVGQGVRRGFGMELLDDTNAVIEDISADCRGFTVTRDNTAEVHGRLRTTLARELAWGQARVRPYMTLSKETLQEVESQAPGSGVQATGGTVTEVDGYRIHTFTASGNFEVTAGGPVEYLIVGGGAGGSGGTAGGGGAGGFRTNLGSPVSVAAGTHAVVVGAGGAGCPTTMSYGEPGGNSSALGVTAEGGGPGGFTANSSTASPGLSGGSGGGGANYTGLVGAPGVGTAGQGSDGAVAPADGGGGGGGAGGAGSGRNGGPGLASTITGSSVVYAGGGGAGGNGADAGTGGTGGGGNGATDQAAAGVPNTGGGGGSGWTYAAGRGGAGGSGIVVIRYPIAPPQTVTTRVPTVVTARFNLGVFVLTTPDTDRGRLPILYGVSGQDLIQRLTREVGETYEVTANGTLTYVQALRDVLTASGLGGTLRLDGTRQDTVIPATMVWALSGAPRWLDVCNDLLRGIAYDDLWCDQDGAFRSGPVQSLDDAPVEWVFDTSDQATDLLAADRSESFDAWNAPNRWRFVRSRMTVQPTTTDGIYVVSNQSDGESSIDSVGVVAVTHFLDVADQAMLVAEGNRIVEVDRRAERRVSLQVDPLPIAGHRDVVQLVDGGMSRKFRVSSWEESTSGRGTWVLGGGTGADSQKPAEQQATATVTAAAPLRVVVDGATQDSFANALDAASYSVGQRVTIVVRSPRPPLIQGVES